MAEQESELGSLVSKCVSFTKALHTACRSAPCTINCRKFVVMQIEEKMVVEEMLPFSVFALHCVTQILEGWHWKCLGWVVDEWMKCVCVWSKEGNWV